MYWALNRLNTFLVPEPELSLQGSVRITVDMDPLTLTASDSGFVYGKEKN